MEIQENQRQEQYSFSDTESNSSSTRIGYSGPLATTTKKKNSSKKSARFKNDADDEDQYVEITLDVRDDSVLVQNIKGGDSETALLASQLERRISFGSQLSFKLRQVSQELRRMASSKRFDKDDRSSSGAARALKGLKFMTKNEGSNEGWPEIEARFHELAVNGSLSKACFGQCIGVFYCGAPGLIGDLRRFAQDFSRKTTTKFDFHKENF